MKFIPTQGFLCMYNVRSMGDLFGAYSKSESVHIQLYMYILVVAGVHAMNILRAESLSSY